MEEAAIAQNPKAKKSQAAKAAEIEQDWAEEGGETEPESVEKVNPRAVAAKSGSKANMEPEFTPRRSSKAN